MIKDTDNYYEFMKNFSIKYQVLSELTAFVLIDDKKIDNGENKPHKIDIPLI